MTQRLHHEDVAAFMAASDHAPSRENVALYFNLIREEYDELWDGWIRRGEAGLRLKGPQQEGIEDTIDALADLIWVSYGMMLALGVDPNEAWSPVARANLSKIDAESGKVLKRADGKVLKPEGWQSPSHAHLMDRVLAVLGHPQQEGNSDGPATDAADARE